MVLCDWKHASFHHQLKTHIWYLVFPTYDNFWVAMCWCFLWTVLRWSWCAATLLDVLMFCPCVKGLWCRSHSGKLMISRPGSQPSPIGIHSWFILVTQQNIFDKSDRAYSKSKYLNFLLDQKKKQTLLQSIKESVKICPDFGRLQASGNVKARMSHCC